LGNPGRPRLENNLLREYWRQQKRKQLEKQKQKEKSTVKNEAIIFLGLFFVIILCVICSDSFSLESGNTLMSGLIDPFFNFLKSIIEAIFDFLGQFFGGLFSKMKTGFSACPTLTL